MAEFDNVDLDVIAQGMELFSVSAQTADVEAKGVGADDNYTQDSAVEVATLRDDIVGTTNDAALNLDATQAFQT